jgi:Glycosyl hydrolase family 12
MRSSLAPLVASGLLLFGCATPSTTPSNQTGSAGSSQSGTAGDSGSGSAGTSGTGNTTGSGTGNTTGSGTGNATGSGTAGSTGSTGTGGSGPACVSDPTNLVRTGGWICDATQPYMIQGAWYGYGDGTSCPATTSNPCTTGNCCMMGATVVDAMYKAWGCGIGMELSSSGGTAPVKSVYTGPTKCFNVTLTGNSGGNPVRIGFSQSPSPPATAVSPYTEIPAFTSGWTGPVCFADVTCPSWAVTAGTCTKGAGDGTPVDLQLQIPGGDRAGTFNVCISKIEPMQSGSTGTGGSGGGTNACASPSGAGTITAQYGDAHVMCPKEYVVQNNAWGQSPFAGQTITFGPGAKLKVTAQAGSGASMPEGYPSIFTGAYDNRNSGSGSGLPRAVSQITAGSLMTSWTWAANGASGSYNAAYDVWFSTSASGDPAATKTPSAGFLMVWFYKPSGNSPIGSLVQNGVYTTGGKQFNIWYGTNNGKPCVSYVAQQTINSWTFSLGDFIVDALGRTCTGSTKCLNAAGGALTTVFSGFEIWNGGVGLETKDFGVTVP